MRYLGRVEHHRERQLPTTAQHQDRLAPPHPPQWFRVPSNTYFNEGALDNLRELDSETVVLVTDALTEERGVIDTLRSKLRTNHVQVFAEVTPEPDESTIRRGVALLQRVQPDL